MHVKFLVAVLSLFVVLKLTKTKYISTSIENIDPASSEILSTASSNEPTSIDSDDSSEPEISLKDLFENFNKTDVEPDNSKDFLPYIPYIILAVVFLGLVYVVKMFLDFMKFCAKFYNKLPKFSSKGIQTSDIQLSNIQSSDIQSSDIQSSVIQSNESKEVETEF
ncbi:unnamed protein product [Larinioides sclopetarius]|uniref:ATP synthase F0 subunit 8 n=1 Tax=Larinioides sclopetarius TaxID=280406 RepID=A0AAV2AX98_9ARAC